MDRKDGGNEEQDGRQITEDYRAGLLKEIERIVAERGDMAGFNLSSTESLRRLHDPQMRDRLVSEIIENLVPDANPNIWSDWLEGDGKGYNPKKLLKPFDGAKSGTPKELRRSSTRLKTLAQKVSKKEDELAAAKAKLENAEAYERALLTYLIHEKLLEAIGAIFAMGPAWVLMRAVSPEVTHGEIERMFENETDQAREEKILQLKSMRQQQSDRICDALVDGAGNVSFIWKLQDAIAAVCEKHLEKRDANGEQI